jgi:hypothetical protein
MTFNLIWQLQEVKTVRSVAIKLRGQATKKVLSLVGRGQKLFPAVEGLD